MSNVNWRDQLTTVDIYITNQCQAGCPSCNRFKINLEDWKDHTKAYEDYPYVVEPRLSMDHMPLGDIRRLIQRNIPRGGEYTVKLCGEFGDPLMHPDIMRIAKFVCKRQENKILIHTNGGLRSRAWWKELSEVIAQGDVVFSIDGTTAEVNNYYRKRVNFERAMDNMLAFAEHCYEGVCNWDYLVFDWNWHQIREANQIARDNNISIEFKIQDRAYGLITDENKRRAEDILNEL